MTKFKKGNKIGNRFTTDNQPPKSGRNPISECVRQLAKDGYTKTSLADILAVFNYLMSLSVEKVAALANDNNQAILTRVVAKEILGNKTGFAAIEKIMDRLYGKPTQATINYNENEEVNTRPKIIIAESKAEIKTDDVE